MGSETIGGSSCQASEYKSILLASQNRFDALAEDIQRMREISGGNLADTETKEHIARLKKHFSLPD